MSFQNKPVSNRKRHFWAWLWICILWYPLSAKWWHDIFLRSSKCWSVCICYMKMSEPRHNPSDWLNAIAGGYFGAHIVWFSISSFILFVRRSKCFANIWHLHVVRVCIDLMILVELMYEISSMAKYLPLSWVIGLVQYMKKNSAHR